MSMIRMFLKTLAIFYFIGAVLHFLDLFDLRLIFSEMNITLKVWTIYLAFFDLLAALGLWQEKKWGEALFLLIAISQLIAYGGGFVSTFGNQIMLVVFHFICLIIYTSLKFRNLALKTDIDIRTDH